MALTYTIIEIRQYLGSWLSLVDITDDEGRIFHQRFNTPEPLTDQELKALIDKVMISIKRERDYDANSMNLYADEDKIMEHLRNIRSDMVTIVRQNPDCSVIQAQEYINKKYPNSIISFDKLCQFYHRELNLFTWDGFKQYIISHKFIGID